MKIISVETMRRLEGGAIRGGVPGDELMRRAGNGAAGIINRFARGRFRRVVLLGGGGNNCGDALVAAAGLCLLPAGAAFLLPVGVMGRYLVLLAAFCGCQLAAGMFSICAVSLVQQRTPRHLTGKVMAFVYTIPLCAQPVGQLLCGALLDAFAGSVWLVLLPGGLLICTAGLASAKLFAGMERDQPPKPQGT